jgi:hypothetical protein
MRAMEHIRVLAREIGPRGSTTPEEKKAAEYAAKVLADRGLEPEISPFASARSAWYPFALFSGLMLIALAFFLVGGRIASLVAPALAAVSVASVLLELAFLPNPLRWILPSAESRNVSARIPARAGTRQKVVLVGHLDSHRTPKVFSSDTWLRVFMTLIPLGLLASIVLLAMFAAGVVLEGGFWRWFALVPGLLLVGVLAVSLQADLTPFSEGANDNASGAGIVLSLAEDLASKPLRETEVWVALTGCEEVGCYGADVFLREHREELSGAFWVTLDSVGGEGTSLRYITKETFLLTTRSDPALLELADTVATDNPALKARGRRFRGAYTEGAIGSKHGLRVLTFLATRPNGAVPGWHRTTDVVERLDAEALVRCESFVKEILARIDDGRSESGELP